MHTIYCKNIQGGPKVDIQYTGNYCIPTFGPTCISSVNTNSPACFDEKSPISGRHNTKAYQTSTSDLHIQCSRKTLKLKSGDHKNVDIIDNVNVP